MMPNYEEIMRKQQEDYQRSRNPFEYGQQVARRRYSEIMSGLDAQRQTTQESYGDLYQQARQRAIRGRAAGGPTLSGGMGQQRRDFVSALEMQELGKIGIARNQALRDLYTQGQSAFANAQLEGQQATQLELQNRAAQLEYLEKRKQILDSNLTPEEKAQQLEILGQPITDEEISSGQAASTAGAALTGLGGLATAGGIGIATTGGAQFAGLTAAKEAARLAAANAAQATFNVGVPEAAVRQAADAAYKASMSGAKVKKLGITGKLYKGLFANKAGLTGIKAFFSKPLFAFLGKAALIYLAVSSIETLTEAFDPEGRGLISRGAGAISTDFEKLLEGLGL